jgi:protein gp37
VGNDTSIEWTDATWNPVRGCTRVSAGCENCYAEKVAARFSGPGLPYEGLARIGKNGARWTGEVRMVPEHLADPLRWKKPRRIFVNSMSDLFHDGLTNQDIAAVFGVMAAAPQHTFQVLTKRAQRMRDWFGWIGGLVGPDRTVAPCDAVAGCMIHANRRGLIKEMLAANQQPTPPWPLPNVNLGVSVENQATADERIPLLLETPAAVRWVSYEPALAALDIRAYLGCRRCDGTGSVEVPGGGKACPQCFAWAQGSPSRGPYLDWLVIGGESGPGARPFNLAWARSVIEQCKAAGVSVFMKQYGSRPIDGQQFTWTETCLTDIRGRRELHLKAPDGGHAATVWPNGTWHTWDRNGVGGENDTEPTIEQAKAEALAAVLRAAYHPLILRDRKGGDLSEIPGDWPREFPR